MTVHLHDRSVALFQRLSKAASGTTIVVGSVVLLDGWLNLAVFTRLMPGLASMKANAALAFLAVGLALWLLHADTPDHRLVVLRRDCALLVVLVGGLTLSEYLVGWDLGIDQLLFNDSGSGDVYSGRMAPVTAVNFVLLGTAFVLLDRFRRYRAAQLLFLIALLFALLAFIGYLYAAESFYRITTSNSVALHTSITFLILSLGMLFVWPDHGWMAIVTSDSAGGVLARRLLPAAIIVPVLLGWFQLYGEMAGLYGTTFGMALFASSNILIFTLLITWSAASLYRIDVARQHAEGTLRHLYADLEARILERTAQLTSVNH